jgi:hypothetical protein
MLLMVWLPAKARFSMRLEAVPDLLGCGSF